MVLSDRYVFGHIEVIPAQRALRIDGRLATIGSRAFDVLLALIERRDRVVTKNELLDMVWPQAVVEENNVVMQVSSLRKLLGPDVIATIPGRGYRLVATASEAAAAPTAAKALPVEALLFGRDADAAELASLTGQHRLVTISGAGGIGKTQLALRHLQDARRAGIDGIGWAELGPLADPSLVVGSVAKALGLSGAVGDPLEGLGRTLQPLPALLVLDNAEHLIDEVARVVRVMLDHAPGLKLLVTSQVPLGLPEEQVMRLGPLSVPDDMTDVAAALEHGSVALFASRAHTADPRFVLNESNVEQVIAICRHLDGLPLAIGLAAARVPLLGVHGIASALGERLRLLTGGSRDAPPRLRTLRAALEWSHGLLTEEDQAIFRRLGVFAGSFSLEMAQHVVARAEPDGLDKWAVVDAMGSLIDRSLLTVDAGEPPRYAMLETPRAYALSQLSAAGEDVELRRRHARAMLAWFEQVDADHWAGRLNAEQALAALSPDMDNAREALAFAVVHDPTTAVALTPSLTFGLIQHGAPERARMLQATSVHITDALAPRLRAAWLIEAARFLAGRKPEEAAERAQAAAAIYRDLGDRLGLYRALIAVVISDFNRVSEMQRQALLEATALEGPDWPARPKLIGVWAWARVQRIDGDHEAALATLRRVVALAEQDSDQAVLTRAVTHVAELELIMGRAELAAEQALELASRLRSARTLGELPTVLRIVAAAELSQGHVSQARRVAQEAWPMARRNGGEADWADVLALLAVLEGRMDNAVRLVGAADAVHASRRVARDPIAAAALARTERLLDEAMARDELQRLRSEGLTMTPEHIADLAFASSDQSFR